MVMVVADRVRRPPIATLSVHRPGHRLAIVGLGLLELAVSLRAHLPQSETAGLIVILAFAVVEAVLLRVERIFKTVP